MKRFVDSIAVFAVLAVLVGSTNPASATQAPVHLWAGEKFANTRASANTLAAGNVGGVTLAAGKIGQAFNFNGNNQALDLGNGFVNFGTADFSVSVWVKPNPTGDNKPVFVKRSANSQGILGLTLAPNGTIGVELRDDGANPCCGYTFTGTKNLADSQWHQVVLVRQGSSIQVYADGAPAAGTPSGNQALNLPSTNYAAPKFIVGTNPYNQFYNGLIDELQIHNRALSGAEVSALFTQ